MTNDVVTEELFHNLAQDRGQADREVVLCEPFLDIGVMKACFHSSSKTPCSRGHQINDATRDAIS